MPRCECGLGMKLRGMVVEGSCLGVGVAWVWVWLGNEAKRDGSREGSCLGVGVAWERS